MRGLETRSPWVTGGGSESSDKEKGRRSETGEETQVEEEKHLKMERCRC